MEQIPLEVWGTIIESPNKREEGNNVMLHEFDKNNYYIMIKIGDEIFDEWTDTYEGAVYRISNKEWIIKWTAPTK